jgi:hypothetical protein
MQKRASRFQSTREPVDYAKHDTPIAHACALGGSTKLSAGGFVLVSVEAWLRAYMRLKAGLDDNHSYKVAVPGMPVTGRPVTPDFCKMKLTASAQPVSTGTLLSSVQWVSR